ncbi:MAG TPA: lasso peptide biosynthesis B2 protein [Frankiaceae bacterium]|nr:lasso peptide biosynthesis B2 protein [Frankiaceae bacterium]
MNRAASSGVRGVARLLALDVTAVDAVTALRAADVDSVLLKGPAMAYWLYADSPGERSYTDVDLLVAPDHFASAGTALAGCGFANPKAGQRRREAGRLVEESWIREGDLPGAVDLHRGFHGVANWSAFWDVMRSYAVSMPLLHASVLIPDAAGIALISALHASEPGPAGPAGRPARDLARACERLDEQVWRAAAERAQLVGAVTRLALGLRLDPGGIEIADRLGLPSVLPPADRMHSVFLEQGAPIQELRGTGARHLFALSDAGGCRSRAALAFDVLVPSPTVLRAADPLATRGFCGLALAYPFRLLRLASRLPAVLRVWLAAQGRGARGRAWTRLGDPDVRRVAGWTLLAARVARRQLRAGRLEGLRLPASPRAGTSAAKHAVGAVLRRLDASCLESAVVRQAWLGEHGEPRDLVIGVRAPAEGFRAHAWLEGDPPDTVGFEELFRRPYRLRPGSR